MYLFCARQTLSTVSLLLNFNYDSHFPGYGFKKTGLHIKINILAGFTTNEQVANSATKCLWHAYKTTDIQT